MILDILIQIRDQLGGLTRARAGFNDLNRTIAENSKQWSGLAGQMVGIGAAVGLLGAEIRHVIANIEKIPGVPQDTIDSINQAKRNFAETREILDGWIASGVSLFSEVGQGLGYLAGAAVYGWDAASDAYGESEEAARRAADAAERAAAAQQKLREEAEWTKAFLEAGSAADKAFLALQRAGETSAERAVRLRAEGEALMQQARDMQDVIESQNLQAAGLTKLAEARKLELAIEREIAQVELARQRYADSQLDAAQQLALVEAEIALHRSQSTGFVGDAVAQQAEIDRQTRLLELERERAELQRSMAEQPPAPATSTTVGGGISIASGPGREDIRGQIEYAATALPTLAESVGNAVGTFYGGAVNSILAGLDGLWNKSMDLGDALVSIARGFGSAFLQSLAQIVAEYAAKKAVMFAIDQLYAAKSVALSIASAAKSLIAWIPSAIAAGISSFGTAAAIGTAAVVAALAAFGGFEDGGPTGGRRGRPAGIVHGEEFVFSAPAVDRIGVGRLTAMHQAAIAGAAPVAAAPANAGGGSGGEVNVAIFDRKTSAEDYLHSSAGERWFYDRYRQAKQRFG